MKEPGVLSPLQVELVIDPQCQLPLPDHRLITAVHTAAAARQCSQGEIGLRITDDDEIRVINRTHLDHDYATDVISFTYTLDPPLVEGELVVSLDTARRRAQEIGWPVEHELMLYVVHGTLHVTGMDDSQPPQRAAMRRAESVVMQQLGVPQIDQFHADMARSDADDRPQESEETR